MAQLTKPQEHILFLLGTSYEQFQQHLEDKPLDISLSKGAFIELAMKSNLVEKQERAIYKNLEMLEKNKCVVYLNKNLILTEKGQKLFDQLREELLPFLSICATLNSQNIAGFTSKAKTTLATE